VRDTWIVAGARSPIGRANKGSLANVRPDDLCASMIQAALKKLPPLDANEVEDVIVGCAQPAGESGYNLGRITSLLAGLRDVPGTTVHRYCASSMQALRTATHAIRAGEGDVFVAAGVETVSRFAKGKSDGHPDTQNPRLPQAYIAMGMTAENVAEREKISRCEMDEFAAASQRRAAAARERGFFAREIVAYNGIEHDDCIRPDTTVEKLAELKPAFKETGTVTAGNACPLNDGAVALVVMSEARARKLDVRPLGRVVSTAVSALDPAYMGLGPIEASRRALARAQLRIDQIDLVEMNEAFAAQVIPSARTLQIPFEKLNVNGGAIALGHPFGMTGARLILTLLNSLAERSARYGLATLCAAGGQGMAVIVERV
jgi:acetyl-CoA C-acetyltransferase